MNYVVDGKYPKFSFPSTLNISVFIQMLPQLLQGGVRISREWFQNYIGVPVAGPGEEVLELMDINDNITGESNDQGTNFSQKYHRIPAHTTKKTFEKVKAKRHDFAEEELDDKLIEDKLDLIDNEISEYFIPKAYDAFEAIFDGVEKSLLKNLEIGKPVTDNPAINVKIGPIQELLTSQGTIAYTEGKLNALNQINDKLEKLGKDPIKFRDRVLPLRFAEEDDFYEQYFKDKNIITRAEYDKIYDELHWKILLLSNH